VSSTGALFVLALSGVAVAGVLAAASLRLDSIVSFTLAVYLFSAAEIVVMTLVLSAVDGVGPLGYAICEALLLGVAAGAWQVRGRPRPAFPRLGLVAGARRNPIVSVLAIAVAIALGYELFIAVATPPNNGDSLTYHLTRAAAWLRHGGLYRIPNGQPEENDFPPNAEIQILYTFAFLRRDTVAALTQWCAQLALIVGVYGCARRLGFGRPASMFAALLTPTLSLVALESMTTQNDLVVASYVVAGAYFVRSNRSDEIVLFGLALGLALGTKVTAVIAIPALGLIALVSLRRQLLVTAAAAGLLGFAVLGSYGYVGNVAATGRPTGARAGQPGANVLPRVTARGTVSTVARDLYHFIDLSGLDVDYRHLLPITGAARRGFDLLHIPTNPPESTGYPFAFTLNQRANEDLSFFGPLGFLLVLPLMFAYAFGWLLGRTEPARGAFALALPLYLLGVALGTKYGAQARWLITGVLLTLPLAASVYRWRLLAATITAVGVVFLALALAHNDMKPTGLRGTTPIWKLSRATAQSIQAPAAFAVMIERMAQLVPSNATMGIVGDEHDPDYLLYGPNLARTLVWLPHRDPLERASCSLGWVYVGRSSRVARHPVGWRSDALADAGTLLARNSPSPAC
jgi:Dolichyl-phosphate-mannose-protein mannosyltransferase